MKNPKSRTPPAPETTAAPKTTAPKKSAEYAETDVITVLAAPEARADSLRAARWTLLTTGMTVGRYLDAAVAAVPSRRRHKFRSDLRRLVAAGNISVG